MALYVAAQLACALLGGYSFVRCDRRSTRVALAVCLLGIFLVMLARAMQIVSYTPAQDRFFSALAVTGLALWGVGGLAFAVHLARRREPSRSGWAGFAATLGASLALQPVLHLEAVDRVVPAAPALATVVVLAWMLVRRRLLFPGLDRMVLAASVPESGGGIVVFGEDGGFLDSGSGEPASSLALDAGHTIEDLMERVRARLVSGRFYAPEELVDLGTAEPGREIALDLPGGRTHYLVFANVVRAAQGQRLGTVFGFYDISLEKRLAAELAARNADLDATNADLRGYLAVAGELEEERERRRVALEVHRTLGTRIARLLGAARGAAGTPPAGLQELLAGCRSVMDEIRSTVRRLDPDRGHAGGKA